MQTNDINYTIGLTVIDNYFINAPSLYLKLFNRIPNYIFVSNFDRESGKKFIKTHFNDIIVSEYEKTSIDCNLKKEEQERHVFVFNNQVVLELGDDYCEILYTDGGLEMIKTLKAKFKGLRKKSRKATQEINIIAKGDTGLELTEMEVKLPTLNLDLYYEDDIREADSIIRKRLNKPNDKGIVLLHGLPGTGKTTYLRHLISKIKKRVLFIPPNMAGHIADPELVKILIDNPDSVLIIEDAEHIVMQRTAGSESAVSNLLNISDGLLSDFLNVQLICTFNTPLANVDTALLRKGRLIAEYEFKKLNAGKAQRLSNKLGFKTTIHTPITLADVFNQHEKATQEPKPTIGFPQAYKRGEV